MARGRLRASAGGGRLARRVGGRAGGAAACGRVVAGDIRGWRLTAAALFRRARDQRNRSYRFARLLVEVLNIVGTIWFID